VKCVRLCRYDGGELNNGFQYEGLSDWVINTGTSARFQYQNGRYFSTVDKVNDGMNCSSTNYGGGWWYSNCGAVSLTGSPMTWMQQKDSMVTSRMMIKRQ